MPADLSPLELFPPEWRPVRRENPRSDAIGSEKTPDAATDRETPIELRRIDPARNMRRFYRLWIAPDLFGGFLLMRQWGRIGAGGRVMAERYDSTDAAAEALRRSLSRKVRRGYG